MSLEYTSVLPELFLLLAACAVLVIDLLLPRLRSSANLTILVLVVTLFLVLNTPTSNELFFGDSFVFDKAAQLLKSMVLIAVVAVSIIARRGLGPMGLDKIEYHSLMMFATLGMMLLISSYSLLTIYIGLELMSLPMYAMIALRRHDRQNTEAAVKYFVLGSLASGLLLYGMSLVYAATGTLKFDQIAFSSLSAAPDQALLLGLVFLLAGIAFKLAAAPFHYWAPDVYSGSPAVVALFLAAAPKIAAFALAMRLLVYGLTPLSDYWQYPLIAIIVLSLAIGNLGAIMQSNIRRLLAYSAIANSGYLLLGLFSGLPSGYAASTFYISVYVIGNLACFGLLAMAAANNQEMVHLQDLKGIARRNPWMGFLLLVAMFSFTGVPPTAGFYAKLAVLKAVVDSGFWWLAGIAVFFSVIGAFYYLRVVKLAYFDAPSEGAPPLKFEASMVSRGLMSVDVAALIVLGLFPALLMSLCIAAFPA